MTNTTSMTQTTASTPDPQQGSLAASFAPIALMLVVFYFLIMRPQKKQAAKKQEMLSTLKRGDKIVTISGIIGVVHKIVNETEVSLEISEGVRMRILKNAVSEILRNGADNPVEEKEAVAEDSADKPEKKKVAASSAPKKKTPAAKKKVTKED